MNYLAGSALITLSFWLLVNFRKSTAGLQRYFIEHNRELEIEAQRPSSFWSKRPFPHRQPESRRAAVIWVIVGIIGFAVAGAVLILSPR